MKKGINYVRVSLSFDQETVDLLNKLAEGDFRYTNSSSVARRAIKEFCEKHLNDPDYGRFN